MVDVSLPRVVHAERMPPGTPEVPVAIVGAGYTGLWTAYYLLQRDPTLRVAILGRAS